MGIATSLQARTPTPPGLLAAPESNPVAKAKVKLGWRLYFDVRLSRKGQLSCAACLEPADGFSDGTCFAAGKDGRPGPRHLLRLTNLGYCRPLFWEGKAATLAEQLLLPIQNPQEMNLPLTPLEQTSNSGGDYRETLQQDFGGPATSLHLPVAQPQQHASFTPGHLPRKRAGWENSLCDNFFAEQHWAAAV